MRLIDIDYLKNILNSGGDEAVEINIRESMPLEEIVDTVIDAYRKCLFAELEKVPTDYDVDKVVEQLKEKILNTSDTAIGISARMVLGKAIDIVKSGGIE